MADYIPDPDWRGHLRERAEDLLDRLSAKGLENAQRIVPVSATGSDGNPPGHLRDSLRRAQEGLSARWGSDVDYSAWVEDGHRIAYRGADGMVHYTGGVVAPEPYLRPSLYGLEAEAGVIIEERR